MQNKKFIQVFEYQKLRYDDSGDFRKHHFDAMVKFNELHQNKYNNFITQLLIININNCFEYKNWLQYRSRTKDGKKTVVGS